MTEAIRLLGISGSPRRRGNSWFLLEQALEAAANGAPVPVDAEPYSISGKTFVGCDSCYRCRDLGDCRHKDDFQELRDKWLAADAIIYSVPVYHMNLPGQLRCFMDRLGNSLPAPEQKYLKAVGAIAQGAHLFSGQEAAMLDVVQHALIMGCLPVTGDMWQSYIGAAGWTHGRGDTRALKQLLAEGDPAARAAVAAATSLGRRVVQVALLVKAGAAVYRDFLAQDEAYEALLLGKTGVQGREEKN
jgi:multimeric flavodoxin WrbA